MVSSTVSQAPRPSAFQFHRFKFFLTGILLLLFSELVPGQEITGLEVVRTLEFENYSVAALDVYFAEGRQLVAFSNNSSNAQGDTLVIYDFAQDKNIAEIPGTHWDYDIHFIHGGQLLFRNAAKLYRVVNLSAPVITELASGVMTFSVSDDIQRVAILKAAGIMHQVHVSEYDSTAGTLSAPDIFEFEAMTDLDASKIAFSPDGNYLAINGGYERNYVVVINLSSGDIVTVNTPDNEGAYSPVFYRQNGHLRLAVGGGYQNGSIEVIDINSLQVEASVPVFQNYNYALDVDASHRYLVCGGYNGLVKIFRVEDTDFMEVATHLSGTINHLLFTQDNAHVVSAEGAGSGSLVIFRIERAPSHVLSEEIASLNVYPNPVDRQLHLSGMEGAQISLYDMTGNLVLSQTIYSHLDLGNLNPGFYLLKAKSGDTVHTASIIKTE